MGLRDTLNRLWNGPPGATLGVESARNEWNWPPGSRLAARATSQSPVYSTSALVGISSMYAGVGLIADHFASLPIAFLDNGREVTRNALKDALTTRANPEMSAYDLKHAVMTDAILHGNGYAVMTRNSAGAVTELRCLPAQGVTRKVDQQRGIVYEGTLVDSRDRGQFLRAEILHIKGLSLDGVMGVNPSRTLADAFALALAVDKFGINAFRGNMRYIVSPKSDQGYYVSEPDGQAARQRLEDVISGDNPQLVALLSEAMNLDKVNMTPEEAQNLGTRLFEVQEIARILRIPPPMLQDWSRSTYTNARQVTRDFVRNCLSKWADKWMYEVAFHRPTVRLDFDYHELLSLTTEEQAEVDDKYLRNGTYTVEYVRERDRLPITEPVAPPVRALAPMEAEIEQLLGST